MNIKPLVGQQVSARHRREREGGRFPSIATARAAILTMLVLVRTWSPRHRDWTDVGPRRVRV